MCDLSGPVWQFLGPLALNRAFGLGWLASILLGTMVLLAFLTIWWYLCMARTFKHLSSPGMLMPDLTLAGIGMGVLLAAGQVWQMGICCDFSSAFLFGVNLVTIGISLSLFSLRPLCNVVKQALLLQEGVESAGIQRGDARSLEQ